MTKTAKYADVILPAISYAEKDGTFTNTERRVQRIRNLPEVFNLNHVQRDVMNIGEDSLLFLKPQFS